MIAVAAADGRYRAAVAELPLSTRLSDRLSGVVAVVAGDPGWVGRVRAAEEDGACAVVVADPESAPARELQLLSERMRIPVIIERPLLRADAIALAESGREQAAGSVLARAIVIDAAATPARLPVIGRDAVGWSRVLAGQRPVLVSADRGLALLETGAGLEVALSVVATERPGRGWVRAQALGEVLIDVEVEGGGCSVSVSTGEGRSILPVRFESSERLALRRAVAAVTADEPLSDLADLIADTHTAEEILRTGA